MNLKNTLVLFLLLIVQSSIAQNIGINNTDPQASLDLQGDLRLRSAILTLPSGINNDVDLVTVKSSVYMFGGGAIGINGCQITGFSGGVDGRIIIIFNNNTTASIQLYDASFITSPSSIANKILTGTGNNATIYSNGSVTLRYDGAKAKWIVISSTNTDGLNSIGWSLNGNIGTNTGNFIGTTDPQLLNFKINNTHAGIIDFTTGKASTSIGYRALEMNTTGTNNTAFGVESLSTNTSGSNNTANGALALKANTTGSNNTAIGNAALVGNTTGYSNVALGVNALSSNTNRSNLVAVGDSALFNNGGDNSFTIFSTKNTAVGSRSLYSNTIGYWNTAIGYQSLYNNIAGYGNTASGLSALLSNANGFYNTATGYDALTNSISGNINSAYGVASLHNNTTGSQNVAVGNAALYYNINGIDNTSIGVFSGTGTTTTNLNNTVTLGFGARTSLDGAAVIGNSLTTTIGGYQNWSNYSDGRFKTNVKENVIGLDFIKALRPVTFTVDVKNLDKFIYKDNAAEYEKGLEALLDEKLRKVETGFIAQEVEAAAKKIGYNFDGVNIPRDSTKSHYSISYASFVVPLVKAVQEQQIIIENLQKELEKIKNKDIQIENELKAIRAKLEIK
jgi:trimeric autotransporter adhesin